MLKCSKCFDIKVDRSQLSSIEERQEMVHITLARSADAVAIYDGKSLCEAHLFESI